MNLQKNIPFLVKAGAWAAVFLAVTLISTNSQHSPTLPVSDKIVSTLISAHRLQPFQYNDAPTPLLIDVANDRVMDSVGPNRRPVVDRKTLLHLLQTLKQHDNYRYILLDIYFPNDVNTEWDSALYSTIAQMRDLVMPSNSDPVKTVEALRRKEAPAFYQNSIREPQFIKYPLYFNGRKSMPMRMYEDLDGGKAKPSSIGSWRSPVVLIDTRFFNFDQVFFDNKIDLGEEALGDTLAWSGLPGKNLIADSNLTREKIIIIGDFSPDGDDVHYTYAGKLPGAIINYNAYLTLHSRHHNLHPIPLLFLFLLLWYHCATYLAGTGLCLWGATRRRSKAGKVALLTLDKLFGFVTVPMLFSIVSFIIWKEVYDIFLVSIFLLVFKSIVLIVRQAKK